MLNKDDIRYYINDLLGLKEVAVDGLQKMLCRSAKFVFASKFFLRFLLIIFSSTILLGPPIFGIESKKTGPVHGTKA